MYWNRENRGGGIRKKSSELLADENWKYFREKVQFRKFSTESENLNLSKIGGTLKHGENASWPQWGMDATGPKHHILAATMSTSDTGTLFKEWQVLQSIDVQSLVHR